MMKSNQGWGKRGTRAGMLVLSLGICGAAFSTTGCRITEDDVHAWARKASGPRKLLAVVQHDKYPMELRVEAAMTLVTMAPRGGHAVGLLGDDEFVGLLAGLQAMSAEDRTPIIDGMIPVLEEGTLFVPKDDEADSSFAYKDAAFGLLQHGEGGLVTNPLSQERLKLALISWCQNNFVARLDDTTQLYGMEQILRYVRAPGVKGLTPLIESDFKKLRQLAQLIHELGDKETKLDASKRMVKVALYIDSEEWLKKKAPAVEAANKTSGLTVKPKQFEKQLEAYQQEELMRMFGAMKSVGQSPIVDHLLAYAANKENPESRRSAALAGLEGNLDRKNTAHANAMLDFLSSDDTPDSMRDVAARRVGELSRDQVASRLYSLFEHDRWQLRWSVASLLLKMSEGKHLDEFMKKLGEIKTMAITEPFSYGQLLTEIKGVDVPALVEKYAQRSYPVAVRLSALGYYYENGSKADLPKVEAYKRDSQKVPSCPKDAVQCAWDCTVPGKTPTDKGTLKTVKTVGNFVEYCLIPAMSSREAKTDTDTKVELSDSKEKK